MLWHQRLPVAAVVDLWRWLDVFRLLLRPRLLRLLRLLLLLLWRRRDLIQGRRRRWL